MGVMDRIASRLGFERRAANDLSWSALAPGIGYYGSLNARGAENLSTVLACVNLIGDNLGYVPPLVYSRGGDARVEVPTHPLAMLARQGVNPSMTWPEFIAHLMASTLLTGNGLAEILRDANGQLSGLRFIPWSFVTVVELSSGRLGYDVADGRGNVRRYLTGEVIRSAKTT